MTPIPSASKELELPIVLRAFRTSSLTALDQLKAFITRRELRRVGFRLRDRIKERTARGEQVGGSRFRRYSVGYAKQKGVSRSQVNLRSKSGGRHMVDALTVTQVDRDRVRLGMRDRELAERARIHDQGRGRMPRRRWLGIGRKDRVWLGEQLKASVRATIRGAKKGRSTRRVA